MRTWTWTKGELTPGLKTDTHPYYGVGVMLGERGEHRKGREIFVSLDRNNPAEVDENGVIHRAFPRIIKAKMGTLVFPVLVKPGFDDGHLVRINTLWDSVHMGRGMVKPLNGAPDVIAVGWNAHEKTKDFSVGASDDVLVAMYEGDEVLIRCIAEGEPRSYSLFVRDNELVCSLEFAMAM